MSFDRVSHVSNNSETKFFMSPRVSGNAIAPCDDSETEINMAACSPLPPSTTQPARAAKKSLSNLAAVDEEQCNKEEEGKRPDREGSDDPPTDRGT